MKKRFFYLSKRIIVVFAISIFLVTFLFALVFNALYAKELDNILASKEDQVIKIASKTSYFLTESLYTVKMAAYSINDLQESGADGKEILAYLENQTRVYAKTINNDFTGIYGVFRGEFLDGNGWVPTEGFVPEERPWYQAAIDANGEIALVTPYLDTKTHVVMMSVCKLLPDRESIVSLDVSLNDIQNIAEESVADGGWLYSLILDDSGVVVAHSNSEELGKEYLEEDESFGKLVVTRLYSEYENYFDVQYQGKAYYVFTAPVMDDWYAVSIMEKKTLLAPLNRIWLLFFSVLILSLCGMLYAFFRINGLKGKELSLQGQIQVLTGMYDKVWRIRLKEDVYSEADPMTGEFPSGESVKNKAQYALRGLMDDITDERFKKSAYAFIEFSTLFFRLQGKASVTMEFLDTGNRKCFARFVPVERDEEGELLTVLWMLEVVEERME